MASFLKISTQTAKKNHSIIEKYWAKPTPEANLSKYYPKDTIYFYSFPSGEDSNFFNLVPAWKEELVAARPLICAGEHVRVLTFASSLTEETWQLMTEELGVSLAQRDHITFLPPEINAQVTGEQRNAAVKAALKKLLPKGKLFMTQPFLDPELHDTYQIPPDVIITLNDKFNRHLYIPPENLPKKFAEFANGKELANFTGSVPFPCVVKITSSSSGDGVRICRSLSDLEEAKKAFGTVQGKIIIEEFIQAAYNLGIQFGVPCDPTQPIEIIGHNEQLTTDQGDYLGGVVSPELEVKALEHIRHLLLNEALPKVRAMGWYGVGGIDVLIKEDDSFYFIDPNFRMTAAFAYVYLVRNKKIEKPIVSFTGTFRGSQTDFLQKVGKIARAGTPEQLMSMIALTHKKDVYRFNAGMFFDQYETVKKNAQNLLRLGIKAQVLEKISQEL